MEAPTREFTVLADSALSNCECGGDFSPNYYSYWEPCDSFSCTKCGRNYDDVVEHHEVDTCTRDECNLCAFIVENADLTPEVMEKLVQRNIIQWEGD